MTIEWRDSLSVGNEFIDDDHKRLIELINLYEKAVSQHNPAILEEAFRGLFEYAHTHFKREEKMMEAVHFPHRNSHKELHAKLIGSIDDFHQSIVDKNRKINIGAVNSFLHDWLIDHVIKEDMKLEPYIKGTGISTDG